jgi:invasion protein IalB
MSRRFGLAAAACVLAGLIGLGVHAWADDPADIDDREILNPRMAMQAPPGMPQGAPVQMAMAVPPRMAPAPSGFVQVQSKPKPKPAPAPAPAPAAAPAAAPGVETWSVACPQPGAQGSCELLRRVLRQDNKQQLLAVVVGPDARVQGQVMATVVLPLGINVRESVPFLIDERFIALLPIETCLPTGCIVTIAMSPPMVQAWRQGREIKFLALTPQGQTVPLGVPLEGFSDGLAKLVGHS